MSSDSAISLITLVYSNIAHHFNQLRAGISTSRGCIFLAHSESSTMPTQTFWQDEVQARSRAVGS